MRIRLLHAAPGTALTAAMLGAWLLLASSGWAHGAVYYAAQVDGREVLMIRPDDAAGALPLVIALHGCSQTPDEFRQSARLEALADAGYTVAVPRAPAGLANPLGCWPWWQPENQRRGGSETAFVAGLADRVDAPVDASRVYALGLSAGGAMAQILATVYPEVFAAVASHSGIGFAAAANTACALEIMQDGPSGAGRRGRLGYLHQRNHRAVPALIIHGEADDRVDPSHARALVLETAARNDYIDDDERNDSFDADADETLDDPGPCRGGDDCRRHRVERFENAAGDVVLALAMVEGLGHDWSGGAAGHRHADPAGPDAAAMIEAFFARHRLERSELRRAGRRTCREWWAQRWWHFAWTGAITFSELACAANPWLAVWRHRIDGVPGPGRCP